MSTDLPTPPISPSLPSLPTLPTLPPLPTTSTDPTTAETTYLGVPIWAWIAGGVALIIVIIIIIVIITAVAGSSRKRSRWDRAFSLRIADARWFADSLTLAVADRTKSAPEIVRTWTDGAPRVATMSQQLYELSSIAPNDRRAQAPRQVAILVDNLRQALDADVRMRTQGFAPGQDALIGESAAIVSQRRTELVATLATMR